MHAGLHSRQPLDPGEALVGVLAHELRTPITTVYAGSVLLARDTDLPPTMRRVLAANIREEAARVFRVVEDLLVLARLDHGGLSAVREPVVLVRAMRSAVQLEAGRWPWLKVRPRVEGTMLPAAADPQVLAHVFRNLIATVGSRSAAGELEMVGETSGSRVVCHLIDRTGAGPTGSLDRIYDLPQPIEEGVAPAPGISMFVARELVLLMGGTVWARVSDGHVELGFDLPAYEPG
jgi:K+-sensing histidine kinase KdpD